MFHAHASNELEYEIEGDFEMGMKNGNASACAPEDTHIFFYTGTCCKTRRDHFQKFDLRTASYFCMVGYMEGLYFSFWL